jgi:8-oxo-dGTP pyrophosphatase MutT (NUDIX family)
VSGFYFRDPDAPEPNRPRRIGAAALIEHEGALLLDHRIDPPGWALVAGSLEENESALDALRREVTEETGLRASSWTLFGLFSDPSRIVRYADGNAYRVITIAFVIQPEDFDELGPSTETKELRLVPKAEVAHYELIATHRPIIELYLSGDTPPFVD